MPPGASTESQCSEARRSARPRSTLRAETSARLCGEPFAIPATVPKVASAATVDGTHTVSADLATVTDIDRTSRTYSSAVRVRGEIAHGFSRQVRSQYR